MNQGFKTELPTPQKIRSVKKISQEKVNQTKTIKTWLFVIVTGIALIFTGLTSYSLIFKMTEHRGIIQANISAAAAIALTDGMLLYWTLIGFRKADSSAQRIAASTMAIMTVVAIAVFGIGEQMLTDGFISPLQMRYIVTFFVVAQIVGVSFYEISSYDAKLSMNIYKANMSTVQLLDKAEAEEAESYADVILAEASARANFAYLIAQKVRQKSQTPAPQLAKPQPVTETPIAETKPQESAAPSIVPEIDIEYIEPAINLENSNGNEPSAPKVTGMI